MAATLTKLRTRYTYHARSMRYRDNQTGRWVATRTVKGATTRVITAASAESRALARRMISREITLGQWQEEFAVKLKDLHVAQAMAGAGGMGQMTPRDYGTVGRRLRFEYSRLERFAKQLETARYTEAQVMARVNMYVSAAHTSHESARFDQAVDVGADGESNELGEREHHCVAGDRPGCLDETARGRVPLGTLTPVGERQCLAYCGCSVAYWRGDKRVDA